MTMLRRPWSALAALVFLLLGAAFITQVVPYRQIIESRQDVAQASARLAALEEENRRLAADVAALGTDAEIEKLAREKLGYVQPGETAYVVLDPPAAETEPSAPPAPAEPEERTWVETIWDFLTGADQSG